MDSLLLALLGCLVGEIGDKSQFLLLALATRYDRNRAVIAGLLVATFANAAISAAAGAWIGPMLGADARLLFLALSLLFLAVGLFWPVKAPDPLAGWPTGAFLTTMLGLFILQFGDGPQFLILGIAARGGDPVLAAVGGAIGIVAACVPVVILRDRILRLLPLRAIRLAGGTILFVAGALTALTALSLV
ncbi:putative Ca2+/H+ antiporter (TMEM165/GDT1 family) [Sphingobium sp. OAS761]|uniref:TMEM165/GDT1 family protein n=1 Tax=Sphingobium sp. OAS761 TaxID=2817901 RepID=UPI0020A0862E|nr:TMEM165/GDT1 family protein [Sphingobium sp. OAS761]MCP1469893.1 putative Ca2+/H+ antiporter (TMEM165/GDT1 family) [Sphingobium sp. OAS761]